MLGDAGLGANGALRSDVSNSKNEPSDRYGLRMAEDGSGRIPSPSLVDRYRLHEAKYSSRPTPSPSLVSGGGEVSLMVVCFCYQRNE